MKISSAKFENFKRFKKLTLQELPESLRMIILVGPNGCGKSSVFDGFLQWKTRQIGSLRDDKLEYYIRDMRGWDDRHKIVQKQVDLNFYDSRSLPISDLKRAFYFRSAYRFEGSFTLNNINKVGPVIEEQRILTMSDADTSVSKNCSRIVARLVNDIHETKNDEVPKGKWRDAQYLSLQESLNRLFPNLILEGPGNPLEDGTFYFTKGEIKNFKYANLSSGEKAALDIILDLHTRTESFPNSIYCLDEPEAHMNTSLHGELLREIYGFIPHSCQLWVATHSIGMIRKAMELREQNPEQVAFLDFHNVDMDNEIILTPAKVNTSFWARNLRTTLADLSDLISPRTIVICEGARAVPGVKNAEFDAICYQQIFESEYPDTIFISVGSSNDILTGGAALRSLITKISQGSTVISLIDRDERTEREIEEAKAHGHRVLPLRHLEHYLLSDEAIKKLCFVAERTEAAGLILTAKAATIAQLPARGYPHDDIKRCKGEIYNATKIALRDTSIRFGSNADAFCRDVMAPLISNEMECYKNLKAAIFG